MQLDPMKVEGKVSTYGEENSRSGQNGYGWKAGNDG
jgi:hypothetical protein